MTPDWIQWILGAVITVLGGFFVYVLNNLKTSIKDMQWHVDQQETKVSKLESNTKLIQQQCSNNHASDIKEPDIRRILKEELATIRSEITKFKDEFKESILKDIKIALFEGEIVVPPAAKRKSPTKKPKAAK